MTDTLNTWATWREIHQQPAVWRSWGQALDVAGLRSWIADQNADEIWFCGAGTSAYIGDIIAAAVPGTRAVPSTDLVANPPDPLATFWDDNPNFVTAIDQLATTKTVNDDGSVNYAVLGGRAGPFPEIRRIIVEAYRAVLDENTTVVLPAESELMRLLVEGRLDPR